MKSIIKKPSALTPIALTAVMLGMMALYFAHIIPPEPTGDEGIIARSFQIWVVLELFAVLFFAFKWLPRESREVWKIIILQIALAIIPVATVWFLEH